MKELLRVTKALADENRLRLLVALQEGELCVCQLTELLELAPPTVSKHLTILHQAELLESRKQGRWVYYRLAGTKAPASVRKALALVRNNMMDDVQSHRDRLRLEKILERDPAELCLPKRRRPAPSGVRPVSR